MNKYQNFYVDTTLEALDQQFKQVDKQLQDIYIEYASNREKLLDQLSRVILDYKVNGEVMELSFREKQAIQKQMQTTIYEMASEEAKATESSIKTMLGDTVNKTYGYQEYLLQLGMDFKSIPLSKNIINKIVMQNLAGDIWSNRLWNNKKALESVLNNSINKFLRGEINVNGISKVVKDRFNSDRYATDRLVRTELARVQQAALEKFDKDHNAEYQLFMATLDKKTSSKCREHDGKTYDFEDKSKPIPPLHPHCRSVLVMIPDEGYRPATRRDNETNEIIPYETYNEWNKKAKTTTGAKATTGAKPPKKIKDMTYKQLEKEAKKYGMNFGNINIGTEPSDIQISCLRENVKFIKELQEEFPQLAKYKFNYLSEAIEDGVEGYYRNGEIIINSRMYGDKKFVNELLKSDFRPRGWDISTDNPINAAFSHEYGHYISRVLADNVGDGDWDKYVKYIRAETKKEYKKLTGETVNIKDIADVLSEYGATDPHETFAEAFSEAFSSLDVGDYAEAFRTVLERELSKL